MRSIPCRVIKYIRKSTNPLIYSAYNIARQSFYGEWERNGEWRFISLSEYAGMVSEWIRELPKDFDIVCAVPRSGLIIGAMIATTLGKPLTTPDQLIAGNVWGVHNTQYGKSRYGEETTVLLVDDSIGTGESMAESYRLIKSKYPHINILWASLFVREGSDGKVDRYYHRHDDSMRLSFEYNLSRLATSYGKLACDMDGVICRDYLIPLPEKEYAEWITNIDPYLIPKGVIDAIVTNREERHRDITEKWLQDHNVEYRTLVMNGNDDDPLQFKIDVIRRVKPAWFWESDPVLSEGIFNATNTPTLCTSTGVLYS